MRHSPFQKTSDEKEKKMKKKTSRKRETLKVSLIVFAMLTLSYGLVSLFSGGITGFAVLDTGAIISENTTIELGEHVTSLRVTGSISGAGHVVLYLGNRVVVDTHVLNESLENYCLETCDVADSSSELHAVVDGDVLFIITGFNYTSD